jgi:hypothetical protein
LFRGQFETHHLVALFHQYLRSSQNKTLSAVTCQQQNQHNLAVNDLKDEILKHDGFETYDSKRTPPESYEQKPSDVSSEKLSIASSMIMKEWRLVTSCLKNTVQPTTLL